MTERAEAKGQLDRSLADLHRTLAEARASLDRARRTMAPGPAELGRLQEDARSGRLGPELRDLATRVADGQTCWDDVFDGTSPYAALLGPHLARMADRHATSVTRALVEGQGVDPAGAR